VDIRSLIVSELDYMIENKTVVIPLFFIFVAGDPAKENSKNKLFFQVYEGNDKYNKCCSYDIRTLDRKDL